MLHIDRQSERDRKKIQPFLDVLVEQHGPGGALELPEQKVRTLQPPVLGGLAASQAAEPVMAAKAKPVAKTGFGAGATAKKAKPKKKKR